MLELTDRDRAYLSGDLGPGAEFAMKIVVRTAETMGATRLLDITSAHVDSCIYNGIAGLDTAPGAIVPAEAHMIVLLGWLCRHRGDVGAVHSGLSDESARVVYWVKHRNHLAGQERVG